MNNDRTVAQKQCHGSVVLLFRTEEKNSVCIYRIGYFALKNRTLHCKRYE